MKGQKEAIISAIKAMLPTFVTYKDIALVMLTHDQLERLKHDIGNGIMSGNIEYSKTLNRVEVMAYARSLVMNHLKKARELNGNNTYGSPVASPTTIKPNKALAELNMDVLSDELKEYVKTLV